MMYILDLKSLYKKSFLIFTFVIDKKLMEKKFLKDTT